MEIYSFKHRVHRAGPPPVEGEAYLFVNTLGTYVESVMQDPSVTFIEILSFQPVERGTYGK